jgi:hypothetical protein
MPAWTNRPDVPIQSMTPGVPAYSAGSKNQNLPNVRMIVTKSAVAANVVTLTVQMLEGNIPLVGDTAYITGTQNNAGALNQPNGVALTGVSISAATGAGTITYSLTTGNLATTSDQGTVLVTISEVAEALVTNQAYRAFALPRLVPELQARRITLNVKYPSAPTSISWAVQGALNNVDSEFVTLFSGNAAGTFSDSGALGGTGSSAEFFPGSWNFVRFKDTGSTGGAGPTVIAELSI